MYSTQTNEHYPSAETEEESVKMTSAIQASESMQMQQSSQNHTQKGEEFAQWQPPQQAFDQPGMLMAKPQSHVIMMPEQSPSISKPKSNRYSTKTWILFLIFVVFAVIVCGGTFWFFWPSVTEDPHKDDDAKPSTADDIINEASKKKHERVTPQKKAASTADQKKADASMKSVAQKKKGDQTPSVSPSQMGDQARVEKDTFAKKFTITVTSLEGRNYIGKNIVVQPGWSVSDLKLNVAKILFQGLRGVVILNKEGQELQDDSKNLPLRKGDVVKAKFIPMPPALQELGDPEKVDAIFKALSVRKKEKLLVYHQDVIITKDDEGNWAVLSKDDVDVRSTGHEGFRPLESDDLFDP